MNNELLAKAVAWLKQIWLNFQKWRCIRQFEKLTPAWKDFMRLVEIDPDSKIARGEFSAYDKREGGVMSKSDLRLYMFLLLVFILCNGDPDIIDAMTLFANK